MQIEQIPLDQILIPEVRVTSYMPEETAAEFRLSVATTGVMEPLKVRRDGGRYILVNGLHRLQEAQARGDATIACAVEDGNLQDVLLENLVTSGLRGKPKASEMRKVIGALEADYAMDPIAIRKKTGLSQEYIENLMWVNRAIPAVQEALDEELISVGHAVLLARIQWPDVQERVLAQQLQYRFRISDLAAHIKIVRQYREQHMDGGPPPEPPPPEPVACGLCKRDYEARYVSQLLVCPSCYALAFDATRDERVAVAKSIGS